MLLAHQKYIYSGKIFDQSDKIEELKIKLKSLNNTIIFSSDFTAWDLNSDYWIDFNMESVDFDHPIWVLFSSGTTGKPKAITSNGGNTN